MQFFQFTREQEMLRKAVREFAEAEIAPKAAEWRRAPSRMASLVPYLANLRLLRFRVLTLPRLWRPNWLWPSPALQ